MLTMAAGMARLGTESAFEVLARAKSLEDQGRDIINLGIGQPDFPTPENIVEAAVKALRDGHHGYTPAGGIAPLRQAVAADIEERLGVPVDPGNVLIVPGGKVTMFFAILMFGEKGAEIIYPNPGFPIYESAINYSGAKAVPMPLYEDTGFSFDAAEVLERGEPADPVDHPQQPGQSHRRRRPQARDRPPRPRPGSPPPGLYPQRRDLRPHAL